MRTYLHPVPVGILVDGEHQCQHWHRGVLRRVPGWGQRLGSLLPLMVMAGRRVAVQVVAHAAAVGRGTAVMMMQWRPASTARTTTWCGKLRPVRTRQAGRQAQARQFMQKPSEIKK